MYSITPFPSISAQLFNAVTQDAASLVENSSKLKCIGGMYSEMNNPTDFICLLLKMLQIQPSKDVIVTYIKNEDMKVQALSLSLLFSYIASYLVL